MMKDKLIRNMKVKNRSESTLRVLTDTLDMAERVIGKPLESAGWDDILTYLEYLQAKGFKNSTIALRKSKLKQFYLFAFDEIENPEYRKIAKRLSDTIETKNLNPQDILTPEEIKRILNAAGHEQDRVIVASLFESGMRVGELLNLRIKDVQMDESKQEVIFHIPDLPGSKTGARTVPCLEIYGYVQDWLKCHPNPDPMSRFIEIETRWGIAGVLDRLFERAGINKPNNPHLVRHSAITHAVASGMQETAIKQRFWGNIGSAMLTIYVHLNEQMQADAYRNSKGMGNGNGNTVINPLAVRCVNCGKLIQSGNLCKPCEDAKKLSEENAELKKRLDNMENLLINTLDSGKMIIKDGYLLMKEGEEYCVYGTISHQDEPGREKNDKR